MNENPVELLNYDGVNQSSDFDASLVSFLIYNFRGRELDSGLRSIFDQRLIAKFEVVICDDASSDGAWLIANRYAFDYPGKITLSRNNMCIGKDANRAKGLQLCKGEYCIELLPDTEFDPDCFRHAVCNPGKGNDIENLRIWRLVRPNMFAPAFSPVKDSVEQEKMDGPLVCVRIINFNYGRYLRQCLDSVFAQTYKNIEICFSDNASTDDSWNIALEYADQYPGRITITRNRLNFGPSVNRVNCDLNRRGKYVMTLCSDDALCPTFVERCVAVLESHSEAGFVMVHREIMDGAGRLTSEPPFYDRSCLIRGEEQAAVYMMSSVNPCISQILYHMDRAENKHMAGNLNDRWFGDRIADFYMCCEYPIVYLKDPLLLNRVHSQSDGAHMYSNLLQCMAEYVLLHQLADIARNYEYMGKVQERLPKGIEKLGRLCLRYCLRCLIAGDETSAYRYFHLAIAIFPGICSDGAYCEFSEYWEAGPADREKRLKELVSKANLEKRTVSYPPPPGSIPV